MSPIIVDKEAKKQEILQAAIRVFAKEGIPNTNIIHIAEEAGIGKGTIYEYFRSKDEIINETFNNFLSKFNVAEFEALTQIENPIEKLLFVVDGWMTVLIQSPDETRVIIEFWADSSRLRKMDRIDELARLYTNYRDFLESIISKGIQKGLIRGLDSMAMASLIAGTLDGITLHWILNKDLFHIEDVVELYKENLVRSLKPD